MDIIEKLNKIVEESDIYNKLILETREEALEIKNILENILSNYSLSWNKEHEGSGWKTEALGFGSIRFIRVLDNKILSIDSIFEINSILDIGVSIRPFQKRNRITSFKNFYNQNGVYIKDWAEKIFNDSIDDYINR